MVYVRLLKLARSVLVISALVISAMAPGLAMANVYTYNLGTVTTSPDNVCEPIVIGSNYADECYTLNFSAAGSFSIIEPNREVGAIPVQVIFNGTYAPPPPNAYVHPKYSVVGVFYAPPCGTSKNAVQYGTQYNNSTDASVTDSYGVATTVTASYGYKSAAGNGFSASLAYGWASTTTTGTDLKVSTTTAESYSVPGCTSLPDGVNHNYDVIWVWLNPSIPYYYNNTTTAVYVRGLAYDSRDPASATGAPDVVPLTVAQLKTLAAGQTTGIASGTLNELKRSWNNTWNAAGTAALNAADYSDILKSDPFASNSTLNPSTLPRFTPVKGVSFLYSPQPVSTSESYQVSTSSTTTASSSVEDKHTVTAETGGQYMGFGLKVNTSWTWDYKWNTSISTATTQNAMITVNTPVSSDGYTGPVVLLPYLDNVYGTYVLYPAP